MRRVVGLTVLLVPLVLLGTACENGEESIGTFLLGLEEEPCTCAGLVEIRLTPDALVVQGNPIVKADKGRMADALADWEEGGRIEPLYNLLCKVREIETDQLWAESFILVQAVQPVSDEALALLTETLDQTGYAYHVRVGI